MEKSYCIWIVCPPGYIHSQAFDEMALGLQHAFSELGLAVPVVKSRSEVTSDPIILGCNLLPSLPHIHLPERSILYNLEQIQLNSKWMNQKYIDLLKRFQVWDFSEKNIAKLKKMHVPNVRLCRIGYARPLTRIPHLHQDIDVLHYGSPNERRIKVLEELNNLGLKVEGLYGIFGVHRDAFVARTKIVLNIHFYEARVFELVRVSYLLANRVFVVSEKGADHKLERPFAQGVAFASYDKLVETCQHYLQDNKARDSVADEGFQIFQDMPQVDFLRQALSI